MFYYPLKPFTKEESLSCLNKYVRDWFENNFKELTPPQYYSFKLISEKKNVLITAPTGSGKTLSGFLSIISYLFDLSTKGQLKDEVYCIYVSPLKALNNDIKKNLEIPLQDIYEKIKKDFPEAKPIRIAVRTGDVAPHEKQKQLREPPHLLITTPESLAIMLNSPKFSEKLKSIEYLIIDEIHELANNKRGVHLTLSVERLVELANKEFVRIGLGATLHPLEEAAKFLVGLKDNGEFRDCYIVDVSWEKGYDLKVLSPVDDHIYTHEEKVEEETYKLLNRIIKKNKTTLIFTNTRSGEIKYIIKEFPIPSPFSHTMLVFGEADIVMMKERRKKLKELHEAIMKKLNIKEEDLIRFVEFAQK